MTNLTYLSTIRKENLPTVNPWKVPDDHLIQRNEWLTREMKRFYSDSEVEEVLSNRRSDFSDEALIADFMRSEQPKHDIPIDSHFNRAVELVTEHFRPNRVLHPVHYPDLRYYPWNTSVSAEAPWTMRDFKFKPMDRSVDEESKAPKFQEKKASKLRKWSKHSDVEAYLKWKQSLGLTMDGSRSFHNLYDEIFIYNRPLTHMIKEGEAPFWNEKGEPQPYMWNTLHARSHVVASDEPDKIRAVFGATKFLLQQELPFIWPLQATYLNTRAGRLLWGREMSRGGWRKLLQEIFKDGAPSTFVGVDWSQFDKRLLHQMIRIVHSIWRSYFDFSKYEPTSTYPNANPKDPDRLERLWKWMCAAITGTPILLPNGQLWKWNWNGFGSGYQQTQLMDTFANAIMIYTCLLALGVNVDSEHFWARFQGDDSIIAFFERMFQLYGNNFLDQLADSAMYYFNAKLNVKKSQIQKRVTGMNVLSYSNRMGMAYRTDQDLLRHLFFPERPQDYGRLAASAIGLAQASLGNSERFHALCAAIFEKIVNEHKIPPKWKALRWLEKTGQDEILRQLKESHFPRLTDLQSQAYTMTERTENENERQWPTFAITQRSFYFLNPV